MNQVTKLRSALVVLAACLSASAIGQGLPGGNNSQFNEQFSTDLGNYYVGDGFCFSSCARFAITGTTYSWTNKDDTGTPRNALTGAIIWDENNDGDPDEVPANIEFEAEILADSQGQDPDKTITVTLAIKAINTTTGQEYTVKVVSTTFKSSDVSNALANPDP